MNYYLTDFPVLACPLPTLSRRHRAWIALYSLDAGHQNLAEVLRQNNVTEHDLWQHFDSWFDLRRA